MPKANINQPSPFVATAHVKRQWTATHSEGIYRTDAWGQGYFRINEDGHMYVHPMGLERIGVDLHEIIEGLSDRGIQTPILLRFTDIVGHRLKTLKAAFAQAIEENEFRGGYLAAYPIKVNQQRQVVEEVARYGHELGYGLEVGSKPELLAVMAMTTDTPDQFIICNGFKDEPYIEAVILAHKLGRTIIPVVENLRELNLIIKFSVKHGVQPRMGVRMKLASNGSGQWATSVGIKSKFGLTITELMEAIETLKGHNMLQCLQLLHSHSGSQHQDISTIKSAITELTHVFALLHDTGARLKYLDIGGGLGVDYQGSASNHASSMNYSLEEYASDVIYRIRSICDAKGIEHPTVVTECGRAMVAYSSVLVFNVLGSTGPSDLINMNLEVPVEDPNAPQPLRDLRHSFKALRENSPRIAEIYHDTTRAREDAMSLFSHGFLTLEHRSEIEQLFWTNCSMLHDASMKLEDLPESLLGIDDMMSETYFANFSLFQSLPDTWAIDQLFPIAPIHRLNEEPTKRAVLADITCDSDGKIDQFISGSGHPEKTLSVHELSDDEPYYLGVFLVGAYQETLGDLHNLFGDPHAVHIEIEDDEWSIREVVKGNTISEVLSYVQFEPDRLARALERECERAVKRKAMSIRESRILTEFYESGLNAYTYLDSEDNIS